MRFNIHEDVLSIWRGGIIAKFLMDDTDFGVTSVFDLVPIFCFYGVLLMRSLKLVLVSAIVALASASANAAIQTVSISGATVDFQYQFDDTLLNLFNPDIHGPLPDGTDPNTLLFSPTNFQAYQDGVTGWDKANATTPLITITAKAGYVLTGLSLFEQGDYYRVQSGSNMTNVSVAGQFIVNNSAMLIAPSSPLSNTMSASGLFDGSETFHTTPWELNATIALNSVATATAKVEDILRAGINLNATALDEAFIEKKLMSITVSTVPVPAPGAVWLFGSAMAGFLVSRRKAVTI